jgi:thiamine biosynthesis lipoprotein
MLWIGLVAAAVSAAIWVSMRWDRAVQVDSGSRVVMGTFSRIVAIAPNRSTAMRGIEAAFKDQQAIEQMMSFHRSDSELAKVNAEAFEHPVQVSVPIVVVLQKAMEISRLSDGAFDVTVGPLMQLWKAAGQAGLLPTETELAEAKAKVGWDKVVIDPNQRTVRFAVQGMKIDMGGIAKGYAVDRCVQILKEQGALGGMVDLGGNIRCFGRPPKGREGWRIGIQDPCQTDDLDASTGGIALILRLTDQAVATSGHYRRFTLIGDRKVSHILNPKTGTSNESLSSDTLIAQDAMTADALSTAVSVLGREQGLALVQRIPGVEAILIPGSRHGDGAAGGLEILKTPGAERFIVKP